MKESHITYLFKGDWRSSPSDERPAFSLIEASSRLLLNGTTRDSTKMDVGVNQTLLGYTSPEEELMKY